MGIQSLRDELEDSPEKRAAVGAAIRRLGLTVLGGIVLLLSGCGGFYSVNEQERAIHTRFGAVQDVTAPGLHFKIPLFDGVKKMDVSNQTIRWQRSGNEDSRMNTYSKDQQPASIAVTVTWHIPSDERTVEGIYRQYGSRDGLFHAVVVPSATEGLKGVFGNYDAVTAIQNRAQLNSQITAAVIARVKGRPVVIDSVQVQDIEFSKAYEDAVEARMTAQVEVQKAEQQKQTEQITADMTVIKAKAEAERLRQIGDAQAEAIRARAAALAQNPSLVALVAAEKWNGVLPTTMVPGSSVPFVNVR